MLDMNLGLINNHYIFIYNVDMVGKTVRLIGR